MKNAARACTTNNYSFLFRKFHLWYQRMNLFFCVLCCQRTWLWYKRFFLYLLLQLNCTYSNRIRRDEKKPSIIKSEACVICVQCTLHGMRERIHMNIIIELQKELKICARSDLFHLIFVSRERNNPKKQQQRETLLVKLIEIMMFM